VIRSIQEGKAETLLGIQAAQHNMTKDVILESYQIRSPFSDEGAVALQVNGFVERVRELKQEASGLWTVLLPPLNWPDVDLYVVYPGGGHVAGVSVKSYARNITKQRKALERRATKARSRDGSNGVTSDSFTAWLGYEAVWEELEGSKIECAVTPSKIRDIVPLSVRSLCMLSAVGEEGES
jgi:hypothetical protein